MRANEIMYSANGSPIIIPASNSLSNLDQTRTSTTPTSKSKPSHRSTPLSQSKLANKSQKDDKGDKTDTSDEEEEEEEEDEDELPDIEAYEKKLEKQASINLNKSISKSNRSGTNGNGLKRKPSLTFRPSLAGFNPIHPTGNKGKRGDGGELAFVQLDNGQIVEFDPFTLDKQTLYVELEENGMSEEERQRVGVKIQDACVAAFKRGMDQWERKQ